MSILTTKRVDIFGKAKEIQYLVTSDMEVFFNAMHIVKRIGYRDAQHVPTIDKVELGDLLDIEALAIEEPRTKGGVRHETIMLTKTGAIKLLDATQHPATQPITLWIVSEVVPNPPTLYAPSKERSVPNIESEFHLQAAIVSYIKRKYPHAITIPGLGENQCTSSRRMSSKAKGYVSGQPDLFIPNHHIHYGGLCIEFKSPSGKGKLSPEQKKFLDAMQDNGHYCAVVDNFEIGVRVVDEYVKGVRLNCKRCEGFNPVYRTPQSLQRHQVMCHPSSL